MVTPPQVSLIKWQRLPKLETAPPVEKDHTVGSVGGQSSPSTPFLPAPHSQDDGIGGYFLIKEATRYRWQAFKPISVPLGLFDLSVGTLEAPPPSPSLLEVGWRLSQRDEGLRSVRSPGGPG